MTSFGVFETETTGVATSLRGMTLDTKLIDAATNSKLQWNGSQWEATVTPVLTAEATGYIDNNDIFIPNAISIFYLEVVEDSKTGEYTAIPVSLNNGGNGYLSLEEASEALTVSMASNDSSTVRWFTEIIIGFGPGLMWVNKTDRSLTNEGSAYGLPKQIVIGHSSAQIGNLKLVGAGPGASTIRGSSQIIVKNLMQPRLTMEVSSGLLLSNTNKSQANGALQFRNRALLTGIFWIGTLSIYLTYDKGPYGNSPQDINTFPSTPPSSDPQGSLISDWYSKHSVEFEVIQFWLEIPNYPILGETPSIEFSTPVFDISVPACSRVYMKDTTILTYIPIAQGLPVSQFITQYRNQGAVTDYFYQDCSFSSRVFGAPHTVRSAYKLINAGKVSFIDSQLSGQLECQSNKLAIFNCYILGTGLPRPPDGSNHLTTQAVLFTVPTHYSLATAPTFGFNNFPSGPRLIMSNLIFVSHTTKFFTKTELEADSTLLPFDYSDWTSVTSPTLNVKFSNVNFYMVHPSITNPSIMEFDGTVVTNLRHDVLSSSSGSVPF